MCRRSTGMAVCNSACAGETAWRTRDEHERGGHAPLEQAGQHDGDGREQQRVVAAVWDGAPVVIICAAQAHLAAVACVQLSMPLTLLGSGGSQATDRAAGVACEILQSWCLARYDSALA